MPECPHGTEMSQFCYQTSCPNAAVGGCHRCFTASASPSHPHLILTSEDLDQILKKFAFPRKVKPECTDLQKAYFDFYQKLKEELQQLPGAIDAVLKTMVNKIGFPYVYTHNHFNTFKRIKNKDYARILSNEFHTFVTETKDASSHFITDQEEKIYVQVSAQFYTAIHNMHQALLSFENAIVSCVPAVKFSHNSEPFEKIRDIMAKISRHKAEAEAKIARAEDATKREPIETIQDRKYLERMKPPNLSAPRKTREEAATPCPQPKAEEGEKKTTRRARRNSIDTQLTKLNRLEEKADNLKKKGQQKPNQALDDSSSDNEIKNQQLPEVVVEMKQSKHLERVEVKPVTRKLEDNHVDFNKIEEVGSPLIMNKIKHCLRGSSDSKSASPSLAVSPSVEGGHFSHEQGQVIQPIRIPETLPPLTEREENSLLLLTASLKLDTKQAIPYLEKALIECEANLSAAEYLSFLYLEDKQPKKCLELCENLLETISDNPQLHSDYLLLCNNKGAALNLLGRYSEAAKFLIGLSDKNELVLKNIANAYYGLGLYDDAIIYYKKAISDGNDDEAFYNMSGCLFLKGNYQAARIAITSALQVQPKKPEYLELQMQIMKKLK